ncbi:MAG: flavodoxin family protein [Candidatus Heimdallarchaeota archaeon]|nr:flavodoxin family protein [Candidatus Heimdallarchaeota archaeon]
MGLKILGVSGSPIINSNTDRAVKAVLDASGLETEFVKLSEINVRPCLACKECVKDNICKVDDDFPALAKKVKEAQALVIGAYCPYAQIDGFTKAFLERLWSMRHEHNLNAGKYVVIIVNGIAVPKSYLFFKRARRAMTSREEVLNAIAREMEMENMEVVSKIKIRGNVPCLTCGKGYFCKMSAARLSGFGKKISADLCVRVEDQPEVWEKTIRSGHKLRDLLSKQLL